VQATGDQVAGLRRAAVVGDELSLRTRLRDGDGRLVRPTAATSIVNGGPVLVRNAQVHVTPRRDGFVRSTNPSNYYGFSAQRNPRTFAGVDARGRTIIATADGRSTTSVGLSITETGAVAQALGMVDGLNLDGGGSTTMVVDGEVTNQPSDAAGERPVGDALLVLPE
jgi:exopolysaccharide biosynthesis protein